MRRDIAAMSWLAPHLIGRIPVATLANPPALVELFAETIVEELDFRLEADNMLDIARVLAETNQRGRGGAPPPPRARDSPRARHGTASTAFAGTTSRACAGPGSTPPPSSEPC